MLLNVTIHEATAHDVAAIRSLLLAAQLPVEDLTSSPIEFLVAVVEDVPVGVIGLERFPSVGLLRSLAVSPSLHGTGLGRALVDALEAHAQRLGLSGLVLLTETAAAFFQHLAYVPTPRDGLPIEMLDSAEFLSLCPASALCMSKSFQTS